MRLFSTNNPRQIVSLRDAVLQGVASDGGLFFPTKIPTLPPDFFRLSRIRTFPEIAFQAAQALFQGDIFNSDLKEIIEASLNFDAPLIRLEQTLHILELFHGETASLNDFSARFLAQLVKRYANESEKPILVLAAEAEPNRSAIANALRGIEGVEICLLYPSSQANQIQEYKPTLASDAPTSDNSRSDNLMAVEIQGSLNDCQALLKEALRDGELKARFHLTAANALNIAWIIPQIFCFMRAFSQLHHRVLSKPLVFALSGGDFGALTAGAFG
jgi:threonine synthase